MRIPIRYGAPWRWLLTILLLPPRVSYLRIDGDTVKVRLGWAFRRNFVRKAQPRRTFTVSPSMRRYETRGGSKRMVSNQRHGAPYRIGMRIRLQTCFHQMRARRRC